MVKWLNGYMVCYFVVIAQQFHHLTIQQSNHWELKNRLKEAVSPKDQKSKKLAASFI